MPKPEKTCLVVQPSRDLRGTTGVPGDKSISHRAVMLAALAEGRSTVRGWLAAGDTEATLRSVKALGVRVERPAPDELQIHGRGILQAAAKPLDFANAGTGIRLMTGIMAGQPFASVLDGSPQLRRRPMKRIITPLARMGADISGEEGRAPLRIQPATLRGIRYVMPVASAQVKSAVLLAGLFAKGETTVVEPGPTRDHSECMLRAAGVDVQAEDGVVTLQPPTGLQASGFPRAGRLFFRRLSAGGGGDCGGQRAPPDGGQSQSDPHRSAGRASHDGGGHTGQRGRDGSWRTGRHPDSEATAIARSRDRRGHGRTHD